jgi:hypothetical protein
LTKKRFGQQGVFMGKEILEPKVAIPLELLEKPMYPLN